MGLRERGGMREDGEGARAEEEDEVRERNTSQLHAYRASTFCLSPQSLTIYHRTSRTVCRLQFPAASYKGSDLGDVCGAERREGVD